MTCGQFPANRLNEPKTQSDIASRPLPKSPASSSKYDAVPQMIVRSSNVRPRKFAIGDAKRLLQQDLPRTDIRHASQSLENAVIWRPGTLGVLGRGCPLARGRMRVKE